ncbi:arginine deiminase family protein [Clostridium sp.]|uniref:dimethylarginine dimethylaminohydrolase family protein n=1 Tax=Clostridium sp. TaxID=1506 RepID=UPI00262D03ED|nr:arginine deiminase family protein [Clostridium sp.]
MKVNHKNRYDRLGTLIMCYPSNFKGRGEIDIDHNLMYEQYNNFINLLTREGATIQFLDPLYGENQVFTRDVGFVIDDIMFIAKMSNKDRIYETYALKKYITKYHSKIYEMKNNIEGGDVIIYQKYVFVGVSKRTSMEALEELQNYLDKNNMGYKVIPIKFNKEKMLHLDCVFNILDKGECLISTYVYDKEVIENIIEKCYYIDKKISEELGTNIICLGDRRIITANKSIYKLLKEKGFRVFYVDYSEILKGGGAFTCSTLPIYRN